jgi:hypothetical protein
MSSHEAIIMRKELRTGIAVLGVLLGFGARGVGAQQVTTISGQVTTEGNTPLTGVSVSIQTLRLGSQRTARRRTTASC